jgi:hypothetical protein
MIKMAPNDCFSQDQNIFSVNLLTTFHLTDKLQILYSCFYKYHHEWLKHKHLKTCPITISAFGRLLLGRLAFGGLSLRQFMLQQMVRSQSPYHQLTKGEVIHFRSFFPQHLIFFIIYKWAK